MMSYLKPVLAIFGLLIIGFFAGFITHRQLTQKEVQRVVRLGEPPMFRERLLQALELDSAQEEQVEAILDEHMGEMRRLMRANQQSRRNLVMELEADLEPLLTPGQLESLRRFNRRFKRQPPPPGGARPLPPQGHGVNAPIFGD